MCDGTGRCVLNVDIASNVKTMTNLLDRLTLELTMHPYHMAIEVWCEETWGERPVRISEWATHDSNVQVFIRLSSSVLIADFEVNGEGMLGIRQHLHVPLETWNPGSIQGLRTSEGKTRFQHRRQSIYLSSELRVPEWGAALLEEWLMSMRGHATRPKDRVQRLNEIKRMKTSVERNLESASLVKITNEITFLDERVDRVGNHLAN